MIIHHLTKTLYKSNLEALSSVKQVSKTGTVWTHRIKVINRQCKCDVK